MADDTHKNNNSGIFRINRGKTYLEHMFHDNQLSWETKGLLGYLLTKPDGWQVRFQDLLNQTPSGEFKLRRMLKEAQSAGYLNRNRVHISDGKFDWITEIYEHPSLNPAISRFPQDGSTMSRFPIDGSPTDGKPRHIVNINKLIKKDNNTYARKNSPDGAGENKSLPRVPGTVGWPSDVKELAIAFATCHGRDPYDFEKARWIKAFREQYLPLVVTTEELHKMYDIAKNKDRLDSRIKSPYSIFYALDQVRKPDPPKPVILGKTEDGGTQVRWPGGNIGVVYGEVAV